MNSYQLQDKARHSGVAWECVKEVWISLATLSNRGFSNFSTTSNTLSPFGQDQTSSNTRLATPLARRVTSWPRSSLTVTITYPCRRCTAKTPIPHLTHEICLFDDFGFQFHCTSCDWREQSFHMLSDCRELEKISAAKRYVKLEWIEIDSIVCTNKISRVVLQKLRSHAVENSRSIEI